MGNVRCGIEVGDAQLISWLDQPDWIVYVKFMVIADTVLLKCSFVLDSMITNCVCHHFANVFHGCAGALRLRKPSCHLFA